MIRIVIYKVAQSPTLWVAEVGGREVARSESPFLDACRALLAEGTDPKADAGMFREGDTEPALYGKVGVAAKLAINGRGTGFQKWRSKEEKKKR